MTATLLLKIASGISLLFAIGHSLGGTKQWSPMGENEVLTSMATVRFDVMGTSRSYLDFFTGFGWSLSVFLLLQSALLWQLSSLAQSDGHQARPMIAMFAVATLASTVIAWRLILPLPAIFSAVLLLLMVAAFFKV